MFNESESFEVNLERTAGDLIDGEVIIINLVTGAYYSLQGVGSDVWAMIAQRRSFGSMVEEIAERYDIDAQDARRDLDEVLRAMLAEDLIQGAEPAADVAPVAFAEPRQPYRRPELQAYRDMQDLLALDPPAPGMNRIGWSSDRAG